MEEPTTPHAGVWRRYAFVMIPVAAAFVVYAGTLTAEFVYDDSAQIIHNPWVRELRHFVDAVTRPVWAFHTTEPTNYFRPFQMGTYNLLWAASGGSPLLFHLVNVLLHATATAALAWLAWRLSRDRLVAFGSALLFAVHPINTEAVAWIACLPELGYAAFGLVALALHVESWSAGPRQGIRLRAIGVVAFTLALLSKETAVTLLILFFLLESWVHPSGKARGTSGPSATSRIRFASVVSACAPYLVLTVLYGAFRFIAVGGVAPRVRSGLTAWDAVLNAPWLVLSYLGKLLWPARLVAFHVFEPVASPAESAFLFGLAGVTTIGVIVVLFVRRRPDLAFAAAMVLVPLLPVLYVPAVGANVFAERYVYLPAAGFTWLVLAALHDAAGRIAGERARVVAVGCAVVLSLVAAGRTIARTRVWHDNGRLATRTLEQDPRVRAMWELLAGWHRVEGRLEDALQTHEKALEIFSDDREILTSIASLEMQLHRIAPEEAVRRIEKLLSQGPLSYEAFVRLGWAYNLAGNPAAAERAFRRAIELNPSSKPAYDGLALALIGQGGSAAELRELRAQSGFSRSREQDRLMEGATLLEAGRLDEAATLFHQILGDNPRSYGAMVSLAVVASRRSDHQTSIELCRKAIDIYPDRTDAYQQLGLSAMTVGDLEQAIEALEVATEIDANNKEIYNRLGVVYARAGRLGDARQAWTRALEIDPAFEKARFNLTKLNSMN